VSRNPDADARRTVPTKGGKGTGRVAPRGRVSPRTGGGKHAPDESALQRAALAVSAAGGPHAYDVLIAELGLPPLEADKYDRNSLRRWVDESQRRDFALGHTVIVNKWILSRTEANLCALIALS